MPDQPVTTSGELLIIMVKSLDEKIDRLNDKLDTQFVPRSEIEQHWKMQDERFQHMRTDVESLKSNRMPVWFSVVFIGLLTIGVNIWGIVHQTQQQQQLVPVTSTTTIQRSH